jgi:hypothetical protein
MKGEKMSEEGLARCEQGGGEVIESSEDVWRRRDVKMTMKCKIDQS